MRHLEYKRFKRQVNVNLIQFCALALKRAGGEQRSFSFLSQVFHLSNCLFFGNMLVKFKDYE